MASQEQVAGRGRKDTQSQILQSGFPHLGFQALEGFMAAAPGLVSPAAAFLFTLPQLKPWLPFLSVPGFAHRLALPAHRPSCANFPQTCPTQDLKGKLEISENVI